jgi:hypothetical protein
VFVVLQKAKRRGRKPIIASGAPGELLAAIRALLEAGHSIGQVEFSEGGGFKITATLNSDKPLIAAPSDYLNIRDADTYAGLRRSRLYELMAMGKLTFKRRGSRTMVSKSSIDRYLKPAPHPGMHRRLKRAKRKKH